MAIRALWVFNHFAQTNTAGAAETGFGLNFTGYPLQVDDISNSSVQLSNGGVACTFSTGAILRCRIRAALATLTDGVSPKSFIAFSITRLNSAASLADAPIVSIGSQNLVFASDYVHVVGERKQIELCIDRVKKRITVYINEKIVRSVVNAAVVDNLSNENLYLGTTGYDGSPGTPNRTLLFKDFLFIDDTQDDTPCTRQGSVILGNHGMIYGEGSGWTSNLGVVGSITNAIGANINTPTAQSNPSAPAPLVLIFDNYNLGDYDIKEMRMLGTLRTPPDTPTSLKLTSRFNDITSTVAEKVAPSTMATNNFMLSFNKVDNTTLSNLSSVLFMLDPITPI